MHTRFFFGLTLLFAFSLHLPAQTEPAEVTRSDDKVVIENRVYYIHIVKQGQTLYSISRAYNVPQRDILLENPSTQIVPLQIGQALKIPYVAETAEPDIPTVDTGDDLTLHTVEPGQTLFFLSQTYGVDMDDIIRLNPGIDPQDLQISQVVRIPDRKVYIEREGFPSEDDNYIYHKVEQGETLSSLSRKYNIPVRNIRRANERLIWGLRYGEYIRIPKGADEEPDEHILEPLPAERADMPAVTGLYDPVVHEAKCAGFEYREFDRPFNVALMLPLYIDRNYPVELPDSADPEGDATIYTDHVRTMDELYLETESFLEFYAGALIALDSLQKSGLSVNLHVYDTGRNPEVVRSIIAEPGFRNMDLIIGPVYHDELRIVGEWARRNSVHIVSPLGSRTELLAGNPWLFQITPSSTVELEQASLFVSNFPSSNFVLLHKNDPFEIHLVDAFKNQIFRNFTFSSDFDNVVFKEVLFNRANVNIEQSLVSGGKNIVIIPSADQAFVSDVLIRLNILSRLYDITIFGLNDWQRFENLNVEYLHNMELHFASPFFIDYGSQDVKNFLRRFRNDYKTEPSHYGFRGYDIMFYFLRAMKQYGPDFHECLPIVNAGLLQSNFLFRKSGHSSGFENNGIAIVKYDKNMNIRRLDLDVRQNALLHGIGD